MIGAPNSLNFNCKVRVMKKAQGPSVSEDIFTNYDIDFVHDTLLLSYYNITFVPTLVYHVVC